MRFSRWLNAASHLGISVRACHFRRWEKGQLFRIGRFYRNLLLATYFLPLIRLSVNAECRSDNAESLSADFIVGYIQGSCAYNRGSCAYNQSNCAYNREFWGHNT